MPSPEQTRQSGVSAQPETERLAGQPSGSFAATRGRDTEIVTLHSGLPGHSGYAGADLPSQDITALTGPINRLRAANRWPVGGVRGR